MKILHVADIHINLNKKNVPKNFQKNRYEELFNILMHTKADVTIISGDIFDKYPSVDEIFLFLKFLNNMYVPVYIIPGNHEATGKGKTFLEFFNNGAIANQGVKIITKTEYHTISGVKFCFFPYTDVQLNKVPERNDAEILVTHIRGEVKPFITEEYDFEQLRGWPLILLGDLHFNHKYKDFPAYYSGSPLNVTFDRDETKQYGINIINYISKDNYKVTFHDLKLPKLIRRTISTTEEMVKDPVNHVIYEITGHIDELSKIENSELLDKKIAHKPKENSKLNLSNLTIEEELELYLNHMKIKDTRYIMKEYEECQK